MLVLRLLTSTDRARGGQLANTIASERTRIGMSQTDLAEMFGKERTTIARWEADPKCIDGEKLIQLSSIFHCSVDYILGISDERLPRTSSTSQT